MAIGDDLTFEGPVAVVDSIAPKRAFVGKHVVHIIFAADLSGRSLERVTSTDAAVRGHRLFDAARPRRRRAPPADPALPRPLAAGRPGRLPRRALGAVSAAPPLRRVSIQGYRAARELELTPGSVCALVGEASSGKSTVLTAIWTLLEAAAPPPTIDDVARDGAGGRIRLEADVAKGTIFLDATAARHAQPQPRRRAAGALPAGEPPLPDARRARRPGRGAAEVAELLQPPAVDRHWAAADGGLALVAGHGAAPRLEPPPLRAPDRGAGALPQPARAAPPLRPPAGARAGGEPDPLLDARAGLPQRRQARGARARPPHADRRDIALPARAARGGGERSARSRSSTATAPSSSSPAARCSSRGGPRS